MEMRARSEKISGTTSGRGLHHPSAAPGSKDPGALKNPGPFKGPGDFSFHEWSDEFTSLGRTTVTRAQAAASVSYSMLVHERHRRAGTAKADYVVPFAKKRMAICLGFGWDSQAYKKLRIADFVRQAAADQLEPIAGTHLEVLDASNIDGRWATRIEFPPEAWPDLIQWARDQFESEAAFEEYDREFQKAFRQESRRQANRLTKGDHDKVEHSDASEAGRSALVASAAKASLNLSDDRPLAKDELKAIERLIATEAAQHPSSSTRDFRTHGAFTTMPSDLRQRILECDTAVWTEVDIVSCNPTSLLQHLGSTLTAEDVFARLTRDCGTSRKAAKFALLSALMGGGKNLQLGPDDEDKGLDQAEVTRLMKHPLVCGLRRRSQALIKGGMLKDAYGNVHHLDDPDENPGKMLYAWYSSHETKAVAEFAAHLDAAGIPYRRLHDALYVRSAMTQEQVDALSLSRPWKVKWTSKPGKPGGKE